MLVMYDRYKASIGGPVEWQLVAHLVCLLSFVSKRIAIRRSETGKGKRLSMSCSGSLKSRHGRWYLSTTTQRFAWSIAS